MDKESNRSANDVSINNNFSPRNLNPDVNIIYNMSVISLAYTMKFKLTIIILVLTALSLVFIKPDGYWAWIFALIFISLGVILWTQYKLSVKVEFIKIKDSETEEALQRYENEINAFKALAEGIETAIFILTPDTGVIYANQFAAKLFNFDKIKGRTILQLTLSYELHRMVFDSIKDLQEKIQEIEIDLPTPLHIRASAWPHRDDDGKVIQVFVGIRDITQLRKLEQVRRDFVANVSHEFRTPLSTIRAIAETILDDTELETNTRDKWLQTIINDTERLARISDDLLILSRIESQQPITSIINLSDVVNETINKLQAKVKDARLQLLTTLPDALPVNANSDQMHQIFINLIDNAIKYTQEGEVVVTGRIEDNWIIVSVADTGIGIMSEHLPRIFERFYRVDKARGRDTGGTGLGLSIVKHIAETHGGSVTVESEYRRGSTFTVRLPKA